MKVAKKELIKKIGLRKVRETSSEEDNIPLFELRKRLRNRNKEVETTESNDEMEVNEVTRHRVRKKHNKNRRKELKADNGLAENENSSLRNAKIAKLLKATADLLI